MRHLRYLLLLVASLATLAPPVFAAEPLRLGIFPYFSAEQLVRLHKPLKDYLAETTGESIQLVSAPDYPRFIQRTAQGRYDILITAPHLGQRAHREEGYRWLGFSRNFSQAVFVARSGSGVDRIEDLAGRKLALPPATAIIHHMALEALQAKGIEADRDLAITTRRSHDQALFAVLRGETAAAAIGRPTWLRYQAPEKETLQVIGRSEQIPGFAFLIHPRVADEVAERFRLALFDFEQTRRGMNYFDITGLEGMRTGTRQDFERLDHYLQKIATSRDQGS